MSWKSSKTGAWGAWLLVILAPATVAEDVLLVDVKGRVLQLGEGWTASQLVRAGAMLRTTDLLYLEPSARAVVLCPDLETVWWPPPGRVRGAATRCPAGPLRTLFRGGQRVVAPRGSGQTERILAPRRSIRKVAPLLRWLPIGTAASYEVQIVPEGGLERAVWGPVFVEGLEQRYPSSPRGRLRPSVRYLVQVRPFGASNFVTSEVPFVVLDAERRQKLDDALP